MGAVRGPFGSVDYVSSVETQLEITTPSWMGHSLYVLLKSWPLTLQMSNHQLLLWATTSSHLPFPGTMFNMCAFFFSVWLNHSLGAFSALPWYRLSMSFSRPELFCLSSSHISDTKFSYSLTWTLPALFLLELSQSWLERLDLSSGCPTWWIFYCPHFILPYQICHLHSQ